MSQLQYAFSRRIPSVAVGAAFLLGLPSAGFAAVPDISCVIHISVDGLRPDSITALGPANAPNFYRFRTEGAYTDNARADYDYTITLPNHTSQLTGRGVLGPAGHGWINNTDPAPGQTLASNKGTYLAGAFDVAHDNGLRTGAFVSKSKFSLYDTSWDATNGALDVTGTNNGRDKLDVYVFDSNTATLINTLVTAMNAQPIQYVFIHLADPDAAGHAYGWNATPGSAYCNAVQAVDSRLGTMFDLIRTNAQFTGGTAIILTTDHGGSGMNHQDNTEPLHYTIPFYVWGPGVMAGAPLYSLNRTNRLDPGSGRPVYAAPVQPIRNGEAGNVALALLGLGPIPGSTINAAQNLALTLQEALTVALIDTNVVLQFTTTSNALYDVQARTNFYTGNWTTITSNIVGSGATTNLNMGPAAQFQQFYRLKIHF